MTLKDFTIRKPEGLFADFYTEKTSNGKPRLTTMPSPDTGRLIRANVWHCCWRSHSHEALEHKGEVCLPTYATRQTIKDQFFGEPHETQRLAG